MGSSSSSSSSSSSAQTKVKAFNNDFYLQMARQILLKEAGKGFNFVFSPLSIHVILSLIAAGSTGETLQQLLSFLKSESVTHLNSLYSRVAALLSAKGTRNNGGPLLSFSNSVCIDKSFSVKPSYKQIVEVTYGAKLKEVDFKSKADQVALEVNSWIKKATNGLITNLISSGSLDSSTALLLTNAIYFKGTWDRKFDASKTQNRDFHLLNGDIIQVPFMTCKPLEKHLYRSFDGFQVVKIPYRSGKGKKKFAMYFFLPSKEVGLQNLIENFSSINGFLDQDFELCEKILEPFWIPRFKMSFGFEASETIKELGLVLPFSATGELKEMINYPHSERLYVSKILHKCFIEVNEEGTEAAASTAAVIMSRCVPPGFVADRPFMFAIKEEVTGIVFFVGAVLNPLLFA